MKNRIRKIRNKFGINQTKFAERISVSRSAVCKMESGENNPSDQTIRLICQEFNISEEWLRYGRGEMQDESFSDYIEKIPSDDKDFIKELIEVYKSLDKDSKDALKLLARKMLDNNKEKPKAENIIVEKTVPPSEQSKTRVIHYFQKVSAGDGELFIDSLLPEKYEIPDIPEYKNADYAVKVKGKSMEPDYNDGDILLIHSTSCIEIGGVGIFKVGDSMFVKKRGKDELISLNPSCDNISYTEDTECQGIVVGKISE